VAVPFVSAVAGAFAVTQAIRIASAQAHHVGITGDVCDLRSVRAALGMVPKRISVPNMLAAPD
jgi:seryl-tRNA(Sec) selenium transferase